MFTDLGGILTLLIWLFNVVSKVDSIALIVVFFVPMLTMLFSKFNPTLRVFFVDKYSMSTQMFV